MAKPDLEAGPEPEQAPACPKPARVQTVVFLDVDGILNVGARGEDGAVLMNKSNISTAGRLLSRCGHPWDLECAERILALSKHPLGGGEAGTLAHYDANEHGFSDVLVSKLAKLLLSTSPMPQVVFSSNWRGPKSACKAEILRSEIQNKLGRPFQWCGLTPGSTEASAQERLFSIGTYIKDLSRRFPEMVEARLLVLDDFFLTPFDGWSCSGRSMDSPEAAERFLLDLWRSNGPVSVKVVHPYKEFKASTGVKVQAAVGLAPCHLKAATDFLAGKGGTCRAIGERLVSLGSRALSQVSARKRSQSCGRKARNIMSL